MVIDEVEDRTPELATTLGLEVEEFIDHFGGCWELVGGPVQHDFDSDPSGGMGFEPTPWHVQGEPWQLMIRVFDHGVFLATPRPQYDGAVPAGPFPSGQTYVARRDFESRASDVVRDIVLRRRRSFRWCTCCRQVNAPEYMYGDRCGRCAMVVN